MSTPDLNNSENDMSQKTDYLERAALGAAMIWGVWTFVPIVGACIAAFLIAMTFGIQALTLPTWAWATSTASIVLCIAATIAMRPAPRGEMIEALRVAAMFTGAVLIPIGVLSIVMSQFGPGSLVSQTSLIERNLLSAGQGIKIGATWVCFFVLPLSFAAVSVMQLFKRKQPE